MRQDNPGLLKLPLRFMIFFHHEAHEDHEEKQKKKQEVKNCGMEKNF